MYFIHYIDIARKSEQCYNYHRVLRFLKQEEKKP